MLLTIAAMITAPAMAKKPLIEKKGLSWDKYYTRENKDWNDRFKEGEDAKGGFDFWKHKQQTKEKAKINKRTIEAARQEMLRSLE